VLSRSSKRKLVVAARCRFCGRPLSLKKGVVANSSYGRCCSKVRRENAIARLGLSPITPADFDGPYLVRRGR
jgi:hypothetical protein